MFCILAKSPDKLHFAYVIGINLSDSVIFEFYVLIHLVSQWLIDTTNAGGCHGRQVHSSLIFL